MSDLEKSMKKSFENHFLGGAEIEPVTNAEIEPVTNKASRNKILNAVKTMSSKSYWNRVNTVEAWGFATKIAIIFPGLLLGKQFWWLYIFAIISSVALIWTSTRKTLPTIILFNVAWVVLASLSILKHFWWF
jgi:hypothetical protein